jgi:hypothetical protein
MRFPDDGGVFRIRSTDPAFCGFSGGFETRPLRGSVEGVQRGFAPLRSLSPPRMEDQGG